MAVAAMQSKESPADLSPVSGALPSASSSSKQITTGVELFRMVESEVVREVIPSVE